MHGFTLLGSRFCTYWYIPSGWFLAYFIRAHPGINGVLLLDTDSLAKWSFHGNAVLPY